MGIYREKIREKVLLLPEARVADKPDDVADAYYNSYTATKSQIREMLITTEIKRRFTNKVWIIKSKKKKRETLLPSTIPHRELPALVFSYNDEKRSSAPLVLSFTEAADR